MNKGDAMPVGQLEERILQLLDAEIKEAEKLENEAMRLIAATEKKRAYNRAKAKVFLNMSRDLSKGGRVVLEEAQREKQALQKGGKTDEYTQGELDAYSFIVSAFQAMKK